MDLTIVIVSFNTSALLDNCLSAIKHTLTGKHISYEIIIVDNASKDDTPKILARKDVPLKVIWNKQNVGFGKANNQGIREATGKYVLLLNSDTIVQENAVERLHAFAQKHPKTFTGGKLLNPDGSSQTSCGPFFSIPVIFASLFLKGDMIGLTRWSPQVVKRVDWVSGACIISKRENFLEDLFFDESIFMYMEEVDLFMRAKKRGFVTYFYPHSRIVHVGTGSADHKKDPVINIYKGLMYIYNKHHGALARMIVRFLLKTKAMVAWCVGALLGNDDLVQTYAKVFWLV